MVPSAAFCFLIVLGITRTYAAVTNEDIRVAILQIVNVVRSTDDKLERHEYRDRVVSDQIKKGMVNIDKRIKMLDPLKGTVGRLDERLAAVETILIQKNEREKMQLQRMYEAVIDIQKNLPVIIEEMKNDIISKIAINEPPAQITEAVMTKKDFQTMEADLMKKLDKITNGMAQIEDEISKLKNDNKQVKDLNNKSSSNLEKITRHINDSQQILTKYDKKLTEFNNKIPAAQQKEQEELKKNVLKVLDGQKSSAILQELKSLHNQVKQLPQIDDLSGIQRVVSSKCNATGDGLKQTLHTIIDNVNTVHNDSLKYFNSMTKLTDALTKNVASANNVLDSQKFTVKDILKEVKNIENQIKQLPRKDDVNSIQRNVNKLEKYSLHNSTLDAIKQSLNKIIGQLNSSHDDAKKDIFKDLKEVVTKSFTKTDNALDEQNSYVKEVLKDIKQLQYQMEKISHTDDVTKNERTILQKLNEVITYNQNSPRENILQTLSNIVNHVSSSHNDTVNRINGLSDIAATLLKSCDNNSNVFDSQKSTFNDILKEVKSIENQMQQLPRKDDVNSIQKNINKWEISTRHRLDEIMIVSQNCPSEQILQNLNNNVNQLSSNHDGTVNRIEGLSDNLATLLKSCENNSNALNVQKIEILENISNIQSTINRLPQKEDIITAQRTTVNKLEKVCDSNNNRSLENLGRWLSEIREIFNKNYMEASKNVRNLTNVAMDSMKSIYDQTHETKEILRDVKTIQNQLNELPQKYEISSAQNATLKKLEQLSTAMFSCENRCVDEIRKTADVLNKTHEDTAEKLNDLSEITVTLGNSFVTNYDKIKTEIQGLYRLDQVMIKTADHVIDTKRRVEFVVHQIMAELNKHSKEIAKKTQEVINSRFDEFEESILNEETGALANVTSKLEEDIQQVWRQIGIMYQQISSNSEVLKQLQNQTDGYVNGTLGTMNSVKGKISQITGRITEVDENLNYLVGRLSLVTQEFNRIKSGLSSAMDQIRESFNEVQNKIKKGPGPHKISSEEVIVPAN